MTQTTPSPDYQAGYRAGVEAAAKLARGMADNVGFDPVTDSGKLMRDTCLDVADNIDELARKDAINVHCGTTHGCICPAGAERNCRGWDCPRRPFNPMPSGVTA
jgi:2,3-bisphosphoglycerate-independent phosphoglycerate mutase